MKKMLLVVVILFSTLYPSSASAENRKDYLLHGSKEVIEEIQRKYAHYSKSFDVLPMIEIGLTRGELIEIEERYAEIEVLPVREYEVAAVPDKIPNRFDLINATSTQTAPYTGKGVKVGIIDSGVDTTHKDLKIAGGFCAMPKEECAKGVTYNDDLGHGTHVAGVIAAQKNSNGIIGIAPDVSLYAIKAINKFDVGRTTDIIAGVEWAIKNKLDVLNMSVTTGRDDPALKIMLDKAYESGIILIAAAGNDGFSRDTVGYPAKYPTVVAVSGVNQDKTWLDASSIGPEVELAAPGNQIISTYPLQLDKQDGKQDGYMKMSGTSMATPHVTGIVALLKERYPKMPNYKIRAMLTDSSQDIGPIGRDEKFGYGLVQYKKEINEAQLSWYEEERGKVILELANETTMIDPKLFIGNSEVKEVSPGKWEVYKLAGSYEFELKFTNKEGQLKKESITVHIGQPYYKDVNAKKWYAGQIAYLASSNWTQGYLDATFKPDTQISRAEAVVLLARVAGLEGAKRKTRFKDVGPNSFASGYIQSAVEKGLVDGFPDGTFRPNDAVTRGEMSLLLQKAYQFPIDQSKPSQFTDMSVKVASYNAVRALSQKGIIQGYPNGAFKPGEPMTRAIYSVFLAGSERPELFIVK